MWSQIVLPVTATLLYVLIILLYGQEFFYKTAIPVYLMGIYYAIRPHILLPQLNPLVMGLYYTSLLFYCVLYTTITSGKLRYAWLLVPLHLAPVGAVVYLHQFLIGINLSRPAYLYVLPDYLLFGGLLILTLAIRIHPQGSYHPTWGDRVDGRRLRSLPPLSQLIPYLMPNRNGANNLFDESFEITHLERYIRQKRKEGLTDFGITHVLLAAYCRGIAKYPALNRFVSGQKIYSRGNDIQFCLTVKKEMRVDSPDTIIKLHLTPFDTCEEIYHKLNAAVMDVKHPKLDSTFDNVTMAFTMIPGLFLKLTVHLVKTLDYFGLLPKALLEVCPFYGSLFFTSMGSLGIRPIYHHLYDLGNLPVFGAFGCKRKVLEPQEDGTVIQKKYIDVKFTLDERIVDGYYYATFFKYYRSILRHPEVLDFPPAEVVADVD